MIVASGTSGRSRHAPARTARAVDMAQTVPVVAARASCPSGRCGLTRDRLRRRLGKGMHHAFHYRPRAGVDRR